MTHDWMRQLFASPTRMGELHRTADWQATDLGEPGDWPAPLRTLVPVMLASNQPMFIVWGPARTLLYNDPYAEILGRKHPQALGQDFLAVWHEIRDDLQPIVAAAYRGEPTQMDDILLWMERRGFREETHFSFFYAPLRDEAEAVCGFLCACTETTGQVMAERRLARSEARYRGVLVNMDEGFVLFDPDFTILEVNDATTRIVGLPHEAILGRNHWERFPGTRQSELGRMYLRAMEVQQPGACEYLHTYPDGRQCWYDVRAYPVDEGLAVLFRDITERRTLLEALRQADRRKDEFLAMLAHELRNPLAPIKTAAHVLRLGGADPRRVGQASDIIERQVNHLARLVDDLLDVSRVTRGLVQLELARVDLRDVLAAAVEQNRALVQARGHALRLAIEPAPLAVQGDFHRLVQVLSNLLNNAAKYTPPGGTLEVRLAREQGRAVVQVTDTGIGIGAELLPHVFELFTQGQRTADRAEGGLGIGLALVRSLVGLHGGEVRAQSREGGPGSTFTVTLPLAQAGAAPAAGGPEQAARAGEVRHVLVVDDNTDAATTVAEVLALLGHTVGVAHSGRGALLRAADGTAWDTFVLDIGLPDMTGHELCRQLRQLPLPAAPVFIALSGYGQEHDREHSCSAGFAHHLVKPAELADLLRAIERR